MTDSSQPMTEPLLLKRLRKMLQSCVCRSCHEGGCELVLGSLSKQCLVVDANKYREQHPDCGSRLCDRFIFHNPSSDGLVLAVVELKSGRVHASVAIEQVENGAKVIECLVRDYRSGRFLPLVLYGRRTPPSEMKVLASRKIVFQGRKHRVAIANCGSHLRKIMSRYGVA